MVVLLVLFAGVAKFRGCSSANGGRGSTATRSEKQHVANVGQPGNWRSASTGEFGVILVSSPHRNVLLCTVCHSCTLYQSF